MNQTGSFIVSEVTRINCNTAGLARTSALLDHFFMNCRVLPQAILAAGRAGSSSAPNCRKGNQGFLLRAVLILLCYTAKSRRITVNLRFVKGVYIFKEPDLSFIN